MGSGHCRDFFWCPHPCSQSLSCRPALISSRPPSQLRKSITPNANTQKVSPQVFPPPVPSLLVPPGRKGSDPPSAPQHSDLPSLQYSMLREPGEHPAWLVASSSLKESGEACPAPSLAPARSDTPGACRDGNRGQWDLPGDELLDVSWSDPGPWLGHPTLHQGRAGFMLCPLAKHGTGWSCSTREWGWVLPWHLPSEGLQPGQGGDAWGWVWIHARRQPEAVHETSATIVTLGDGCE